MADIPHVDHDSADREGAVEKTVALRRAEAAERALAEAAARRAAIDEHARAVAASPELHGRGGLEPVRYDDWEVEGRAVDF